MSVKRHSFWWENTPPDFAFQTQLPKYADIVIIGGGFAGMSTAVWLSRLARSNKSKKTLKVLVLEEAPYGGFKATGRMTGSAYLGTNKSAAWAKCVYGEKDAKALYEYSYKNNKLLSSLISKTGCDFEFNGGIRMAGTLKESSELKESAEILAKWGFYSVYFDHDKSQHVAINPLSRGSLFIPGEGMIDPFEFNSNMARSLRRNGVHVSYGTRVSHTETTPEGPRVHLDNGHIINAGKIVHATTNVIPDERVQENIVRRRETVVRTDQFSPELDDMPLPLMPIELNGGMDSLRVYDQSIVMVGGKAGLRKKDPEVDVRDDTGFNQRILDHLDSTMVRNFPFSNHTEISHAWTYIETETIDNLPLVGELQNHNGQYINVAFGRNKFGLAFLASKNLAERITRTKVEDEQFSTIFNPKRLTRGE